MEYFGLIAIDEMTSYFNCHGTDVDKVHILLLGGYNNHNGDNSESDNVHVQEQPVMSRNDNLQHCHCHYCHCPMDIFSILLMLHIQNSHHDDDNNNNNNNNHKEEDDKEDANLFSVKQLISLSVRMSNNTNE